MRTTAEFLNIGKVEVQLTITASVDDWLEIVADLEEKYPSGRLKDQIKDVIKKLQKSVYYTKEGDN